MMHHTSTRRMEDVESGCPFDYWCGNLFFIRSGRLCVGADPAVLRSHAPSKVTLLADLTAGNKNKAANLPESKLKRLQFERVEMRLTCSGFGRSETFYLPSRRSISLNQPVFTRVRSAGVWDLLFRLRGRSRRAFKETRRP